MVDEDLDDILNEFQDDDQYKAQSNEGTENNNNNPDDSNNDQDVRNIQKYLSIADITDFGEGYLDVLSIHEKYIKNFNRTINDVSITESIHKELNRFKYNFSRHLEAINKYYTSFVSIYNFETITKKAKKEFNIFFNTEEYSQNRHDFLILKEVFLTLREFNAQCKKEWENLKGEINIINSFSNAHNLFKKTQELISEILDFCYKTELFLRYLAMMLNLSENNLDILEKEINKKIIYFDNVDYNYSRLFETEKKGAAPGKQEQIKKLDDDKEIINESKIQEVITDTDHSIELKENISEIQKINISEIINFEFKIKGTNVWNSKEPYILKIDEMKLKKEYSDLKNSIYFNEEKPDSVKINGLIQRAIFKYMRNPDFNILSEYDEFIYKEIIKLVQNISNEFNINDEKLNLFIYHIGPFSFYKILTGKYEKEHIGECFIYIEENKILRLIPKEYIKVRILSWFEENINIFNLPFDKVSEFNVLKKMVTNNYYTKLDINNKKINQAALHYFQKTGKKLNKISLMQKKGIQLFGIHNIIIYKRFIDKTIF